MLALVAVAQLADLAMYFIATSAGQLEGNPLMGGLGPTGVTVAKLFALGLSLAAIYRFSLRGARIVTTAWVIVGAAGVFSAFWWLMA
jgi:hypothetical protein